MSKTVMYIAMNTNNKNNKQTSFDFSNLENFNIPSEFVEFDMPDANVSIYRNIFNKEERDFIFKELLSSRIQWSQKVIKFYGKAVNLPRLTAWYGDVGAKYKYSNISMNPHPWIPVLTEIKGKTENLANSDFNSVLLNLYRDGKDGVSWHQDDEIELGNQPIIASVSFGETRVFQLRHKYDKDLKRVDIPLTHGSILIMKGTTQEFWQHRIPKTRRRIEKRVNLTFRKIFKI
ncbi:hypothetical protein NKDENANG_02767 [Candidatus Entotheonellaceae bacterium PAL068K]